ncbi:hypothetical protein T06_15058, partial [Trichinella sp. T6]
LGKTFYCAKVTPGIYWYLRRVPTLDCRTCGHVWYIQDCT